MRARLQARRPEIEQAILTRVYSVSSVGEPRDPEYVEGLRRTVSAGLDYGLDAVEGGEDRTRSVPSALLEQARLAARNGTSLDTVLRRYFAGYTLLGDFLIQVAEERILEGAALQRILREQALLFDHLLVAVTAEYTREMEGRLDSSEQRRAERVQRLLDGELVDTTALEYDFDSHHLGVIAAGPGAPEGIRKLAGALDRRLLLVPQSEGTVWAWFGGRQETDPFDVERLVARSWPEWGALAVGEQASGLAGWRLSHRQAKAALPIALRSPERLSRYGDVAMLAAILGDDLFATSLRELYLAPLAQERDGGETLRETLRAYFVADRNVSSAAAALEVSRQTVINRLRMIEERIDRPLVSCAAEIDAALRLEDLGYSLMPHAVFAS